MEEASEPRVLHSEDARPKLNIKATDVIIFAVIAAVIISLTAILWNNLSIKHDVAAAQAVSDKLIADIGKRDGSAALKLGSQKFRTTYSATALTKQFKAIELVTGGTPTIQKETLGAGPKGKSVLIIYKYPPHLANLPFYVQVTIDKKGNNPWQLEAISGNADETMLSSY